MSTSAQYSPIVVYSDKHIISYNNLKNISYLIVLFLGNLWLIKSSIFQINQMIRVINLKVNENKTHK